MHSARICMLAWGKSKVLSIDVAWGYHSTCLEQWAIGVNSDCISCDLMLPAAAVPRSDSHASLPASQLSCMHGAERTMPIDDPSQNGSWTHEIKQLLHVDMQAMDIQAKWQARVDSPGKTHGDWSTITHCSWWLCINVVHQILVATAYTDSLHWLRLLAGMSFLY